MKQLLALSGLVFLAAAPSVRADPAPEYPAHDDPETSNGRPDPEMNHHPATCDAAHDHCLHRNTWFVAKLDPKFLVHHADPSYRTKAGLLDYLDNDEMHLDAGDVAVRTAAATLTTLKAGALVAIYKPYEGKLGDVPEDSYAADTDGWSLVNVGDIDTAKQQFQIKGGKSWVPLAVTRVVVERVDAP